MGWAKKNLTITDRDSIARSLFVVKEERTDEKGKIWLNGLCPLHKDAEPSFGYCPEEDVYHCLAACVKDGDLIDLFCRVSNFSPAEGMKEFRKRYDPNYGQNAGGRTPPRKQPEPEPQPDKKEELPPVDLEQMAKAYESFPPLPENWRKRLAATRGWDEMAIAALGLKYQTKYRCKFTGSLKQTNTKYARIVFPIRDQKSGDIVNLRLYDPAGSGKNKIISWGRGVGQNRIWPQVKQEQDVVWICEGEADTVCARSLGLEAYTQTAKVKKWPADQVALFANRDVVIAYDADKAGVNYAKGAAESLMGTASRIRVITWPDYMMSEDGSLPEKHGQDLTDFVISHGRGAGDLGTLAESAMVVDELDDVRTERYWDFFGLSMSGRDVFQPMLLGEELKEKFKLLNDPGTGLLYAYNGRCYEQIADDSIRQTAIAWLGEEFMRARVEDSVYYATKSSTMKQGRQVNDQDGWICIRNGMFNVYTYELRPHDPFYLSTVEVDVDFDPQKLPPAPTKWFKFLEETVQTPECIEQLQEFFGYCLTRETRYETCLIMIGDGGDGKSTSQKILRSLVGEANCTSISFDGLEDQFQRAGLYNKMVNLSAEVGGRAIDSEFFKRITSGDKISAAFKHKDSFEFTPFAKLVFAVNKMPKILDNSDGLYRRLLPIWYKRQFLPGDPARDPHLEDKLMAELPGIFGWALAGLKRLRERGCFDTNVPETQQLLSEYKEQNSPVYAFMRECLVVGEGYKASKEDLYAAYKSWCGKNGFGAVHKLNFLGDLRRAVKGELKSTKPRDGGKRVPTYEGVGLTVEVDGEFSV